MPQFISISDTIEARQYEGDKPLVVVHDELGEVTAYKGDWLIGTERGKIRVMTNADFNLRYQPFTATPESDALKAAEDEVAALKTQVDGLTTNNGVLAGQVAALQAGNFDLGKKVGNTVALTAEVADLTTRLEAAQAQVAADEQKLADLTASLKAASDAQAALQKSQDDINKTLGA